ncbi:hypothetical protein SRHO_G00202090 [Serrasalmus rhombeus]
MRTPEDIWTMHLPVLIEANAASCNQEHQAGSLRRPEPRLGKPERRKQTHLLSHSPAMKTLSHPKALTVGGCADTTAGWVQPEDCRLDRLLHIYKCPIKRWCMDQHIFKIENQSSGASASIHSISHLNVAGAFGS